MSMGKQIIVTDYSAHTEFCTSDNAMLVPINETEPAYDGIWFHGKPNSMGDIPGWASIGDEQIDVMIEHMRNVHKNKPNVNTEGIKTAERFSWRNTVKTILDRLSLGE